MLGIGTDTSLGAQAKGLTSEGVDEIFRNVDKEKDCVYEEGADGSVNDIAGGEATPIGSISRLSTCESSHSLMLDSKPPVDNFGTPNISFEQSESECSTSSRTTSLASDPEASEPDTELRTPDCILSDIRVKNLNRVTIGTLNINSLAPKFE